MWNLPCVHSKTRISCGTPASRSAKGAQVCNGSTPPTPPTTNTTPGGTSGAVGSPARAAAAERAAAEKNIKATRFNAYIGNLSRREGRGNWRRWGIPPGRGAGKVKEVGAA